MRLAFAVCSLVALLATAPALAQEELTRLLRQPDIQGDQIAFVYGGDLWVASTSGGLARRLTSDDGLEQFPRFSPDGRWIAFTGEYSGTTQVHVISTDGGTPRQLTFYNDVGPLPPRGGVDNRVVDWTPDGKHILFLPHRLPWSERMGIHYTVPFDGGMEQPVGIPEGSGGMYSPDGGKIVYTPIEREFRTWKRYRGGRAQDIWIWDVASKTAQQITDDPATDNQPVWIGNTIYFTSDRAEDRKLNLWAYDLGSKSVRQATRHEDWDVLWPSSDGRRVVYEAGGWIWLFDPSTGASNRIPIRVFGDFRNQVAGFVDVKRNIETFELSPTGVRALFGARGDVFTAPAEEGEVRNLTQTPGVREMAPSWSPDGRWVAYLSDRTGEYEIWVRPADGSGDERRITTDGSIWRFEPVWSPDSKKLLFSDKRPELQWVDVASGKITKIDRGDYATVLTYTWSPDSRWVAYSKVLPNRMSTLWVHDLGTGRNHQLTSGMTNDDAPVFDPKGRYLYFLSDRDFNLTFSGWEFNYVYTDPTRVYVAVLAKDGPALFLPESDEETPAAATPSPAPAEKDEKPAKDEKKPEPVNVRIDVDGFESRVRAIPGSPSNYRALSANATGPIYLVGQGPQTALKIYNLEEKKEETILEGVQAYDISADGQKLIVRRGQDYAVVAAKTGQKPGEGTLKLAGMTSKVDPKLEWAQEFNDAWRILRDWFYDPNMHGVNWAAMRARYGQLVPHLAHRSDLDFVLGELGGELDAGHVYVGTPEGWQKPRTENGLLGAVIEKDPSGYYRIAKIFPGENWHEDFRSPLTEPGVRVSAGDYILAVDGTSTKGVDNFYRLLENKADRVVTLRVAPSASGAGAREERVRPVKSETNLRYLEWIESRRAYVEKKSGGRIGYIHLPNTAQEGNRELFKGFYPQATKDALIIDDRYNGGGFIPDRMIEVLDRPVMSLWARRNIQPNVTPGFAHAGPKAMLTNGYSSSGGDALPYYFRQRGLGPIIGTRTWGGLIGISFTPPLMDGGTITAPAFRFFDPEGKWAVEGVGVEPDIEVVDRPDLVAKGIDPSLDKAIEVLLAELEKNPRKPIVTPVPPISPGRTSH